MFVMLQCYYWIIAAAFVQATDFESAVKNLPNFHAEKRDQVVTTTKTQDPTTEAVGLPHLFSSKDLIPAEKPEKVFPKLSSGQIVHVLNNSNSEDVQNGTADSVSPNKTESSNIPNDKDGTSVLKKSENVKKAQDDDVKLKGKKLEKDTSGAKVDDTDAHGTPSYKFPNKDAVIADNPIHIDNASGHLQPAKEMPPTKGKEDKKVDKPLPKFPAATKQTNETSAVNNTAQVINNKVTGKNGSSEADDMNKPGKYDGSCDVDNVQNIGNGTNCLPKTNNTVTEKATESSTVDVKHHPDAEILPGFDKNGPHSVPEEKKDKQVKATDDQHSVHLNTNKQSEKIVAAPVQEDHKDSSSFRVTSNGITIFVISLATIAVFGYVGLVVWKKIMIRRSGREILINEEEFCEECTDSHQFEMNQQQNRNVII